MINTIDYNSDEFFDYIVKLSKLTNYISDLIEENEINVNELFRELHSIKAITYYFNLEEISILIEKTETILMFINNYDCGTDDIMEWLEEFAYQLNVWVSELNNQEEISLYDLFFEEMPYIYCESASKVNKISNIIFSIGESTRSIELQKLFKTKFKQLEITDSINSIINITQEPCTAKIITNTKFSDGNIVELITKLSDISFDLNNLYLIVNFTDEAKFKAFKSKLNINNIINIRKHSNNKLLDYIYDKCKSNNIVQVPNNNLSLVELSQEIKPLSKTIIKLKSMCFGDSNINEISNTIKTDPMFSAILLKNINTPFVGLPNRVSKVSIAVALMGKKRVGSIVMSELSKDLFDEPELKSYGVTIDNLLSVSQLRASFVTAWIKYIDISPSNKEFTSALIHLIPIGQILVDKALQYNKSDKRFLANYNNINTEELEKKMAGWTRYNALTKIFELWNMPQEMINISETVAYFDISSKFPDLKIIAAIILLSTKIFKSDGTYKLTNEHLKFAKQNMLVAQDMENIYNKIVKELPDNIYDLDINTQKET